MAEVYVTLGEAAELERVKYNTMVKRVLRKQESFVTKTEKSENGGKDVVLVAVSSLSKQARNAWKEREKLKSFTEEFPDKKEDEQKPEVPWYVNTDVDWYIENYKERYYKAVELGNVVRKFLQYDEGDRTKYAEEFAQKYLGKGQRTLYRYTKAYLEASAWADKLEKEDGAGREFFKVLCLCRKPKETGCFPSIKPEVKQVIKNIWFNEDFARNQGTREMLYEKLTAMQITGANDVDIMLDEDGQPVSDGNGDTALVSDDECWLQDIKNEAMTEEGELFYEDEEGDASYGWSLLDFMQGEYDDFTQMEIQQRIRSKMSKRDYIDAGSIQTTVNFDGHIYHIRIAFRRTDSNSEYNIDIESNGVEVIVE